MSKTTAAAFAGTYASFAMVKTRGVFQIQVELPIERAQEFIGAFGVPMPGEEKWVALALLAHDQKGERSAPEPHSETTKLERKISQLCAIRCADTTFQEWLCGECDGDISALRMASEQQRCNMAAEMVRTHLGVASRRDIDDNSEAADAWFSLVAKFERETDIKLKIGKKRVG